MNLGAILAIGLAIFLGNVVVIALFYGFGKRQQQARPEPPKGHT